MAIRFRKLLSETRRKEKGLALPAVLALLALGGLIIVPTLNYVTNSLHAGEALKENFKALYAADAGVEDASWKLIHATPTSFPYSYQLTNINGMTVDVVIQEVTAISGVDVGSWDVHEAFLALDLAFVYTPISANEGIYSYTLTLTNNGVGNVKLSTIILMFPARLEYANNLNSEVSSQPPVINGDVNTGETLIWDYLEPRPNIPVGATKTHSFQMSGPPNVKGSEGHGAVVARRDDVGTFYIGRYPFSITAQARDASGNLEATVQAGVWAGIDLYVSCWEINP